MNMTMREILEELNICPDELWAIAGKMSERELDDNPLPETILPEDIFFLGYATAITRIIVMLISEEKNELSRFLH